MDSLILQTKWLSNEELASMSSRRSPYASIALSVWTQNTDVNAIGFLLLIPLSFVKISSLLVQKRLDERELAQRRSPGYEDCM